jgi:hypothetical protein
MAASTFTRACGVSSVIGFDEAFLQGLQLNQFSPGAVDKLGKLRHRFAAPCSVFSPLDVVGTFGMGGGLSLDAHLIAHDLAVLLDDRRKAPLVLDLHVLDEVDPLGILAGFQHLSSAG